MSIHVLGFNLILTGSKCNLKISKGKKKSVVVDRIYTFFVLWLSLRSRRVWSGKGGKSLYCVLVKWKPESWRGTSKVSQNQPKYKDHLPPTCSLSSRAVLPPVCDVFLFWPILSRAGCFPPHTHTHNPEEPAELNRSYYANIAVAPRLACLTCCLSASRMPSQATGCFHALLTAPLIPISLILSRAVVPLPPAPPSPFIYKVPP